VVVRVWEDDSSNERLAVQAKDWGGLGRTGEDLDGDLELEESLLFT
jgi:hypothetical protein